MSFGEILSRFFELAKMKWRVLMGVSMVYAMGVAVLLAACVGPFIGRVITLARDGVKQPDFNQLAGTMLPMLALLPALLVLAALYLPAVALASLRANRNEPVRAGEAWAYGFAHFWRFLWLIIRQALIITLPALATAALVLGGAAASIAWSTQGGAGSPAYMALVPLAILLYLGIMAYGIWLAVRFSFAAFAAVDEEIGAARAMARSWLLTRNIFWRVFSALAVVYLILYAAQMLLAFALYFIVAIGVVVGIVGHADRNPALLGVLIAFGVALYLVFIVAMTAAMQAALQAMLAILYDDQRRKVDFFAQPPMPTGVVPSA